MGGVEKIYTAPNVLSEGPREVEWWERNYLPAHEPGFAFLPKGRLYTNNLQSNMHANGDPYHPI
jgi:hypothetical protein